MSVLAVFCTFHRVVDRLLQRPKTGHGMLLYEVHCTIRGPTGVPREDIFMSIIPSLEERRSEHCLRCMTYSGAGLHYFYMFVFFPLLTRFVHLLDYCNYCQAVTVD